MKGQQGRIQESVEKGGPKGSIRGENLSKGGNHRGKDKAEGKKKQVSDGKLALKWRDSKVKGHIVREKEEPAYFGSVTLTCLFLALNDSLYFLE